MEQEELTDRDLAMTVQVPGGQETSVSVNSSKPVMDLFISLCGQYHLNPSDHIIELISANQNHIKFKPNSMIGSLEAERLVLKHKGREDSNKMVPNVPVATVRLMVNYRQSHKAVVRVNPKVPLAELMPAVCDKCEFDPNTTVLLRDSQSEHSLDLTKTLNDYGIRELYAKDKVVSSASKNTATSCDKGHKKEKLETETKWQGAEENSGFFSLFRRPKTSVKQGAPNTSISAMSSLRSNTQVADGSRPQVNSATPAPPMSIPKKRRAPQPPRMPCSQSPSQSLTLPADSRKGMLSRVSSAESSLKSTKRQAPPPPRSNSLPDRVDEESCRVGATPNLSSLEKTQEEASPSHLSDSTSNQYSGFTTDCSSISSPSLMTEILYEYMDILKAQKQEELSSDRSSVTFLPPTVIQSPALQLAPSSHATVPDSDPIQPPGCGLRYCSQREGLTTFTVVPPRRQPSLRHYEVLVTLEAQGSLEGSRQTGILDAIINGTDNLEWRNNKTENLDPKKSENLELKSAEMVIGEKGESKSENLEEGTRELGILSAEKAFGNLKLNADTEKHHPEEKEKIKDQGTEEEDDVEEYRERRNNIHKCRSNLEWTNNGAENSEPKKTESLDPNDTEMVSLQKTRVQSENLEKMKSEMAIQEASGKAFGKLTTDTATDAEEHPEVEIEDLEKVEDLVLKEEKRDWVEEYKIRRRRFQGDVDDRKAVKLDRWTKEFEEGVRCRKVSESVKLEEGAPPSSSAYCKEGEQDKHEEQERKVKIRTERKKEDISMMLAKSSSYGHMSDIFDSCCADNPSSDSKPYPPLNLQPPAPSQSKLNPKPSISNHQPSSMLTPTPSGDPELDSSSSPILHSIDDPPPPSPVSLFALAVSQRAQSLRNKEFTLTPSVQGSTPPPPRFFSQTLPSQGSTSQSPLSIGLRAESSFPSEASQPLSVPASQLQGGVAETPHSTHTQ
ncbi:uncharacterized protein cobll1a isoform X2 [Brachyhypopomus gauderio]